MPLLGLHCRRRELRLCSGGRQSRRLRPSLSPSRAPTFSVCRRQSPFTYPAWTSREQGEAGREAVEEVAASDRSDLPGAERSRQRDRPQQVLHHARVVIGNGEEVTATPVAREQQRGLRVHAGEHLPEILVGGARVPDVELHGLAHRNLLADRQRARALVGTEQVADEEVAPAELGLVLVDDETDVQAAAQQLAFLFRGRAGELLEALDRRLPAQLLDEVLIAPGDDVGAADRTAALRYERADLDAAAVDEHADRALVDDVVVEYQAVPTRAPRRRRQPTDDLQAGEVAVDALEERIDRERERVREEQQAPGRLVERRPARQRGTVGRLLDPQRDRRERGTVETGCEDGEGGVLLDLVGTAGDRDGGTADEHPGFEDVAQRGSDVLERSDMMRRREAHGEIRSEEHTSELQSHVNLVCRL